MTASGASAVSFEEHFAREILASERVRLGILAGVLAALMVLMISLYLPFGAAYREFFSPRLFMHFAAILAGLIAYALVVRGVMGRRLAQGRRVPEGLRYLNAFVETSVPTLLMLSAAREANPAHVLQSPAALLYGVFIVLSTLRLDYRLSVFTGAVAAVEYVALCLHFGARGAIEGTPFALPPFFVAKAAMLLLAGLAAGFVAHQVKRRIGNAWRGQQERQRLLDAFGQQVSPAIVDELLRQGGAIASRRAAVCVLFLDIRNFTPLVEGKTPEEIVALQNAVFGEAIEVVNRHHGIINQFLGDGFMATFGAPVSSGRDCANALAAARELVAAIRALGERGRIPAIGIGIGLHTGEAVSGNIGSAQRQQYSITGNVVILAARIEQLNKEYGSQILVSREVLAAAGEEPAGAQAIGPVKVKGREQPIEIFRLA